MEVKRKTILEENSNISKDINQSKIFNLTLKKPKRATRKFAIKKIIKKSNNIAILFFYLYYFILKLEDRIDQLFLYFQCSLSLKPIIIIIIQINNKKHANMIIKKSEAKK